MPITAADVLPSTDQPAVAPDTAVAAPEVKADATIPDDILAIPAVGALLRGSPPALSDKGSRQEPELQVLKANVKPMIDAGFGFFKASDGTQVLYNTRFTDEKELTAADKAGRLDLLAPPFVEIKSFFAQSTGGAASPPPVAGAAASAAPSVAVGAPPTAPAPAGAQRSIVNARLRNAVVGEPTSGAAPGGGRLLNAALKPVV